MEVLQISDIHFRLQYEKKQTGYGKMLCQMRSPLEKLDFCLEKAFSAYPGISLLLISGDLCEDGDPADYEALRKFLEQQLGKVSVEVTLGNHDRKEAFWQGWLGEEKKDCPYHKVQRLKDMAILSLDSSCYGNSNGEISERAVRWLENAILDNEDLPLFLMTHHHFLDGHESIPAVKCPEKLKELIRTSEIRGIFCGHTHHCFAGYFQGKPYYTADGLSFYGTNLAPGVVKFEEKYGYNYYEIQKGRIIRSSQETFSDNRVISVVDMKKE